MDAELQGWLRARDWPRVRDHFARVAPVSAADFESRGLATMSLQPGAGGARLALPDLRRALDLQPHNPVLAVNLLQGLIDAGEVAEACRLSSAAVQALPASADLRDKHVQALVAAARWDDALQAVTAEAKGVDGQALWAALREELQSRWWRPLSLGGLSLRLPCPDDRDFITRSFRDRAFMTRFHRFQPADDASIDQFIQRSGSRPRLNRRLDWIVHRGAEAIGLASLVDLDHEQRRAELLVGFPQAEGHPAAAALKASLAAMQFAFGALKLNRLISYVYGDNPASQANTLHLGLRQEGLLREHLRVDGVALDLHVNGLLAREYFADARLLRLLQRWGGEHSS